MPSLRYLLSGTGYQAKQLLGLTPCSWPFLSLFITSPSCWPQMRVSGSCSKLTEVPAEVPRSLRKEDRCVNLFLILLGGALLLMASCHWITNIVYSCFRASFPSPSFGLIWFPLQTSLKMLKLSLGDGKVDAQRVTPLWRNCLSATTYTQILLLFSVVVHFCFFFWKSSLQTSCD